MHSLALFMAKYSRANAKERDVSDVDDPLPSIALRLKAGQMLLTGHSVTVSASALSLSRLTVTDTKSLPVFRTSKRIVGRMLT
jgi:hypothetical protein